MNRDVTPEDIKLLLQDLCARLPYKPKIQWDCADYDLLALENCEPLLARIMDDRPYSIAISKPLEEIKPYLCPMSSMTEEEKRELQFFYPGCLGNMWLDTEKGTIELFECSSTITLYLNDSERIVDWLNKKMFDFRGLISKGLALEAPEGMYN